MEINSKHHISALVLSLLTTSQVNADFRTSLEVLGISDDPFYYGTQANGTSGLCTTRAVSDDGNIVAFHSQAANLVEGDTNLAIDVFVKNLETGTVYRASVDSNRNQSDGDSYCPALSADGSLVIYLSNASNLRGGALDQNTTSLYVHDLRTGTTEIVSKTYYGAPDHGTAGTISNDGRFVLFQSRSNEILEDGRNFYSAIYLHDRESGSYSVVDTAAYGEFFGGSSTPFLAGGGRHAVFVSYASNLVDDDTNGEPDVFWKDLETGFIRRVNTTRKGRVFGGRTRHVSVSDNGQVVAFDSNAQVYPSRDKDTQADIFVKNVLTESLKMVSVDINGRNTPSRTEISLIDSSGTSVAFAISDDLTGTSDPNAPSNRNDLYVTRIEDGFIQKIEAVLDSSYDARVEEMSWRKDNAIVFSAPATPGSPLNATYDVFIEDLESGATQTVSESESPIPVTAASSSTWRPTLSNDGTIVAFSAGAADVANQPAGGSGGVWRDLNTETNHIVPSPLMNMRNATPRLSGDGKSLIYVLQEIRPSLGNTRSLSNLFHYDVTTMRTTQLTLPLEGTGIAGGGIRSPRISDDGQAVMFRARSNILVTQPTPGWNTFVVDTQTTEIDLIEGPAGRLTEVDFSSSGHLVAYTAPFDLRQGQAGIAIDDLNTGERFVVSPSHPSLTDGFVIDKVRIAEAGNLLLFTAGQQVNSLSGIPLAFTVFVHERLRGVTSRVRLPFPDHDETLERAPRLWNHVISENGRYIAYVIEDDKTRFYYRYDRTRSQAQLVGTDRRNCPCETPVHLDVADNGYVVFDTWMNMGVQGESRYTDAYLYGRISR